MDDINIKKVPNILFSALYLEFPNKINKIEKNVPNVNVNNEVW
jgi:hypothetical protein